MAEGARQLSPFAHNRWRGGIAALAILLVLAGSAVLATLLAGIHSGMSTDFDGLLKPALFTLWQALLSTALSIMIALPVAVALESLPGRKLRDGVLALFAVPLSLPAIVAVLAVLTVAGRTGWIAHGLSVAGLHWQPDVYGLPGILIVHVFFNMPLAVRLLASACEGIAEEQWKLAASLKFPFAARLSILLWPAMRAALPGIAGLIFMLCAASYTIILVIGGGPASATLQTAIQQALTFDLDIGRAAWLTLLHLALTFLLVLLLPHARWAAMATAQSGQRRWHVAGSFEKGGAMAASMAGALLVATPLLAILTSGLSGDHARILSEQAFWRAMATSAGIGTVSAVITLILAWLVAAAEAIDNGREQNRVLSRVPLLLIGMPPLVLGTGWFLLALKAGAVTTMAPLAIIAANTLMALPFALQILSAPMATHFAATDSLAASLRLAGWKRLRIADLPALKRPLASAFLFAFALSLGDLGVITLFGSDQILTLPALIYAKMGAYRSNDAAVLSLYLALITGLIVWLATKGAAHDRS